MIGSGDDCDRAVRFGARDAAAAALAGEQAPLPIARIAVRVVRRHAEHADSRPFVPSQDTIIGNVAEQQGLGIGEPDRALAPAHARVQLLHLRRTNHIRPEALVVDDLNASFHLPSSLLRRRFVLPGRSVSAHRRLLDRQADKPGQPPEGIEAGD